MRTLGLAVVAAPAVASLALLACEDDPSSSSGLVVPEGGGFDSPTSPTEGGADGGADADAGSGAVVVTVQRSIGPAANVTVIFHDAVGVVLATTKTGADGKASFEATVPGMVSALLGGGTRRHIMTWLGVQAGDQLFASDLEDRTPKGSYLATMQGDLSDAGATFRTASVGRCASNPTASLTFDIPLYADCVKTLSSVLAYADSDGTPLRYAFKKSNAPPPPDGGAAPVALGPWVTPAIVNVKPLNAPDAGQVFATLDDIAEGNAYSNQTGAGVNRFGVAPFSVAPNFAEAQQATIRYSPPVGGGASKVIVGKRVNAPQTQIDIDFAGALPALDSASLTATDIKRPKVDWHAVAPLTAAKGGMILLTWFDSRTDERSWSFVVPPSATAVTAPILPAEADAWAPQSATDASPGSSYAPPFVIFVDASVLPNAAAFRREAGRVIPYTDPATVETRAILPANGDLKITSRFDTPL